MSRRLLLLLKRNKAHSVRLMIHRDIFLDQNGDDCEDNDDHEQVDNADCSLVSSCRGVMMVWLGWNMRYLWVVNIDR